MKLVLAALAIWLLAAPVAAADDCQEAWAALVNGSHVALIRHGNARPATATRPVSRSTTARPSEIWMRKDERKPRRSARPSVNTACAQTRSCPRPGAGAWRRRG
jgi:hypothetical protein